MATVIMIGTMIMPMMVMAAMTAMMPTPMTMVMKKARRKQRTIMPERDKRKRPAPISYRPPKAMREEFARRVAASGMNANAFITQSIFEVDPPRQVRRAPVNSAEIARLVGECARLRDRLASIEADGAGEEMETLVAEAILHLTEIRTACFEALGRRPRSVNGGGDHDDEHHDQHQHDEHQHDGGDHDPSPERRPS